MLWDNLIKSQLFVMLINIASFIYMSVLKYNIYWYQQHSKQNITQAAREKEKSFERNQYVSKSCTSRSIQNTVCNFTSNSTLEHSNSALICPEKVRIIVQTQIYFFEILSLQYIEDP